MPLIHYETGERVLLDGDLYTVTKPGFGRWGNPCYRIEPITSGRGRWLTPRGDRSLAKVIDRRSIRAFVHAVQDAARIDDVLSPTFETRQDGVWEANLERLVDFWAAELLGESGFTGDATEKRGDLDGVEPHDFDRWLGLFEETLPGVQAPPEAGLVLEHAKRIGSRLRAAIFDGASVATDHLIR